MKFSLRDLLLVTVIVALAAFLVFICLPPPMDGLGGRPVKGTLLPNSPAPAPNPPKE